MELRRIEVEDKLLDNWNETVDQFSTFRIYHSYQWLNFIEQTQKVEKIVYRIFDKEDIIGYFPGFIIKKGFIKIFSSPFEGWTTPYMGPLINDNIDQNKLLQAIYKVLRKDKFHFAQFTHPDINIELANKNGFLTEKSETYIAPLGSTPQEIKKNFSKSTRKCVRRAYNNGLIVTSTTDSKFIDFYYEQLCQVFAKSNMRPTYPKSRVELLWNNLMPTGKLIATWVIYEGQVIATRVDFYGGEWLHSFGSASNQEFLKLNPNELARYHVMCIGAEKGLKHYDMSGGGIYKGKFGAQKTTINKIVYSLYGLQHVKRFTRYLITLKFKLFKKKIK